MAAYFLDIDGTTVFFGTDAPLPGAIEHLKSLLENGDQVIFTTQRGNADSFIEMLIEHGLGHLPVIVNVQSPRVIVNDAGAFAVNPETDQAWWKLPWRNTPHA